MFAVTVVLRLCPTLYLYLARPLQVPPGVFSLMSRCSPPVLFSFLECVVLLHPSGTCSWELSRVVTYSLREVSWSTWPAFPDKAPFQGRSSPISLSPQCQASLLKRRTDTSEGLRVVAKTRIYLFAAILKVTKTHFALYWAIGSLYNLFTDPVFLGLKGIF